MPHNFTPWVACSHAVGRWRERFAGDLGEAYLRASLVTTVGVEHRLHDPGTGAVFCIHPHRRGGWLIATVMYFDLYWARSPKPPRRRNRPRPRRPGPDAA